jgi:hypothetical protein
MEDEAAMHHRRSWETPGGGHLPTGFESAPSPGRPAESDDRWDVIGTRTSPAVPPRMEPSRKIDKTPKKRSFFRRLFGLK